MQPVTSQKIRSIEYVLRSFANPGNFSAQQELDPNILATSNLLTNQPISVFRPPKESSFSFTEYLNDPSHRLTIAHTRVFVAAFHSRSNNKYSFLPFRIVQSYFSLKQQDAVMPPPVQF